MPNGLFVTGTDTGVGKTVVSAALLRRLRTDVPVCYWKPIQTGIEQDDDTAEVSRLAGASAEEIFDKGVRLRRPVSPHLAAELSGCSISLTELLDTCHGHATARRWIVEGAGGVLVPINGCATMATLMTQLRFPVIVVARTTLGTINHTLMTVEALRHRSIEIAGVVMVGTPDDGARRAIEHFGGVAVLGELPRLQSLTGDALEAWSRTFDPTGQLVARLG